MDYKKLGSRIRDRRLSLKLSQDRLSEMVDVSSSYLGQIERADRKLSLETLVSIANALGVTADVLLFDSHTVTGDTFISQLQLLCNGKSDRAKQAVLDVVRAMLLYLD